MVQKISPYVEGKYGWNFGESGWNSGMDENLTKFSFLFDRNIDDIVSTLPVSPSNGQAFFLTTDKRMYFRVESTWYSTPTPKWFEFQIRSTGVIYRFDGTSVSVVESASSFDSRIDALEITVSELGTAAFQNLEYFASQSELDVVSAESANYTDALRDNITSNTGADMVGWERSPLSSAIASVGQMLSAQAVSVWEYAAAVTDKPTVSDPSTWDWTPAIQAAHDAGVVALSFGAGTFHVKTLSVTHDFAIYALGSATVLRRPNGYSPQNTNAGVATGAMIDVAAASITLSLRNLTLDGNEAGQAVSDPSDTLVRLYKQAGSLSGTTLIDIEGCTFLNQTSSSIVMYGLAQTNQKQVLRVRGCTFLDGRYGIGHSDPSSANENGFVPVYINLYDAVEAVISDNVFAFRKSVSAPSQYAPSAIRSTVSETLGNDDSPSAIITGNRFYNLGRAGYMFNGAATGNNDIGCIDLYARGRETVVSGNFIVGCPTSSIRGKVNSSDLAISNNVIVGSVRAINIGPTTRTAQRGRIAITGNVIRGPDVSGIQVVGETTNAPGYVAGVTVTGNLIEGVTNHEALAGAVKGGIYIRNASGVLVSANRVQIASGDTLDGILLRDCTDFTVTGNNIRGATNFGIYALSFTGTVAISSNVVNATDGAGIRCAGSGQLTVSGNACEAVTNYGIQLSGAMAATLGNNVINNVLGSGRGIYIPADIVTALLTGNQATVTGTALFVDAGSAGKFTQIGNSWNPRTSYATAAPTTGAWLRGDIVYHVDPAAGGFIGWVCTASGSPGTWKSFGPISA